MEAAVNPQHRLEILPALKLVARMLVTLRRPEGDQHPSGPRLEVRSVWECQCCGRMWETVVSLRPAVSREARLRRLMAEVAS